MTEPRSSKKVDQQVDQQGDQTTALVLGAQLMRSESYRPWWAPLWGPVDWILSFLPSHRDTRKGRSGARQVKIVLLIVGVAFIAFGEAIGWVAVGLLTMLSALILPLSELRKRVWTAKVRALLGEKKRPVHTPGKIVHDGRRVELHEGDAMLRRVLVDKVYSFEERVYQGQPCLGLMGHGKRKKDTIWICARGVTASEGKTLGLNEVDVLSFVDEDSFDKLLKTLSK